MAKSEKKERVNVSAEEFVKAYIASSNAAEVATKTGMTVGSVSSRATNLRKKGVKLPKFERKAFGGVPIDVDGLNALIDGAAKNATATKNAPAAKPKKK